MNFFSAFGSLLMAIFMALNPVPVQVQDLGSNSTVVQLDKWTYSSSDNVTKPTVTSSSLQIPSLATTTSNICLSANASGTFTIVSCGAGASTTLITSANSFLDVAQVGVNATLTAASVLSLANTSTNGGLTFSSATGSAITGVLTSLNNSQWTNDSGYVTTSVSIATTTASNTWTATSSGNKSFTITLPSNVGFFSNDSGYVTSSITIGTTTAVGVWNATSSGNKAFTFTLPSNVGFFTNDAGYVTSTITFSTTTASGAFNVTSSGNKAFTLTLPSNVGWFSNDSGYITAAPATTTINGNQQETFRIIGDGTSITSTVSNGTTTFSVINYSSLLTTSTGLTVSNFASPNISQWTNNSNYISTVTFLANGGAFMQSSTVGFTAGTNVTITTSTGGTYTISASGGSASAGAPTSSVQYNGGGAAFQGYSGFNFINSSTNPTLTVSSTGGSVQLQASSTSPGLKLSNATSSRCARFDSNSYLVAATGDCTAGDTTGTGGGASSTWSYTMDASNCITPSSTGAANYKAFGTYLPYSYWAFDQTAEESVYCSFGIPANFAWGTSTIEMFWTSTSTAADPIAFRVNYAGFPTNSTIDIPLANTSTIISYYASTTASVLTRVAYNMTSTNFTAGQMQIFKITREVSNASDTLATDARLLKAVFTLW